MAGDRPEEDGEGKDNRCKAFHSGSFPGLF
jgi:hypothetical protein